VGNNSTQSIGTVGFAPDWIWAKNRDTTGYHHELYDRTRGDNLRLFTSQTDAEITGYLQFDSDGFNLTSGGGINNNTDDHVAWNWRANGAGTSVTFTTTGGTGSISGTRSVNTDIGFSLITYTAASSDPGETRIAHGLGVAPKFHLIKCIDATSDGAVYHYKNGTGKMEIVNSNAYDSGWNGYNGAHPNSTYISLNWQTQASGAYRDVNEQSREYVMYAFAEVEGFSKIGMYTDAYVDNYTTDSPFVYCGFRPAWVMIKSTSASRDWVIADNKRNTSNVITNYLRPNKNNNTFTGANLLVDFMANGFKIRGGDGAINTTGENYIFIAFAENPFKYANAR